MMWRSSADFKHFKKLTMGGKLLVGYNTNMKLPPLPGREVYIAPRSLNAQIHTMLDSIEHGDVSPRILETLSYLLKDDKWNDAKIKDSYDWCIGGKKTYERFCQFFEELHISHIDNDDIGDTMFPDLREMSPDCKIFNYYFKTS
jgi:dihydrofolate reductase